MSYDIYLLDPMTGRTIQFDKPHALKGGTYALGGTPSAWLNVTYNYSPHFYATLGEKGIRTIYGMTAEESLPVLREAAKKLKGRPAKDYWAATSGNAKAALHDLISLAERAPQGVWGGD